MKLWECIVADTYFAAEGFTGYRARDRWVSNKSHPLAETMTWGAKQGKPRCVCSRWENFYYAQCDKAASYQDAAGRGWCGNHSPKAWLARKLAQKAREDARLAAWTYERQELDRKKAERRQTLEALQSIRDNLGAALSNFEAAGLADAIKHYGSVT